jgi:hypothetical protein
MQYLPNKTAGDVSDQDINNCIDISSVVNKRIYIIISNEHQAAELYIPVCLKRCRGSTVAK